MPPEVKPITEERKQTDESLRVEREKADHALSEELAHIDETADAVINRARVRADEVLASTRARSDRRGKKRLPSAATLENIQLERGAEDQEVREERASADEALRLERADYTALLANEREETDKDLFDECAQSDDVLATRDRFLGIVSHDLRNMLQGMVSFAALIAKQVTEPQHEEDVLGHARRIQRSGARMNRLIGDLVDVASIEAGMLAVTRELGDPLPVVTEAVDTFQAQATANGVSLVAEVPAPLPQLPFDPARILQVLTNILSNAIKFTPVNGKVVVRVERVGDDLRFAVSDTGVGIPSDRLEAVFERFLQITKNDRRGLGLGLFISKCIVQGHGGRIWAESAVGGGSRFCFTIPIVIAA